MVAAGQPVQSITLGATTLVVAAELVNGPAGLTIRNYLGACSQDPQIVAIAVASLICECRKLAGIDPAWLVDEIRRQVEAQSALVLDSTVRLVIPQ